ncbi:MAG: flagellar export protein FliJ [Lachnospiraceae bacterium]|nr:flagellar export protein FliJ [Lachnospiraceae bacterium]
MARFRYRMQSILDIKYKMEEQAKMDYATARMRLTEEEEKKEQLKRRKQSYEEESRAALKGRLKVRKIQEAGEAILRMDEYIVQQDQEIRKAQIRLDAEREKLTELMKERKTHEKLREKAFEQFLAEENARESKEIDELTSYTYGQKQKQNQGG